MISLRPGDQIDHYRVEGAVARSNMASIFRATDLRTSTPVAIKVPHPEMESDPVYFERFHREEEIGKRLDHPGVMKIHAEDGRRHLYMVMEWVEGQPLRTILRENGKVPLDRALRITAELCGVLEYIHSQGVVHRDLKPENIMVDVQDHVKLIDFGIAALAGARRLTFTKLTDAMGTADYISPEQVKGKRGDARSDIYALGVMLYEMLTGQTPFSGPNAFAIMNDRVLNNPVPPREVNPAIPPTVQEIIYRALERDPKNRYSSAREFAWDLEHLDQVAVEERPEMRDWKRRRSPWLRRMAFYLLLFLIPVIIFGLLLWVARH